MQPKGQEMEILWTFEQLRAESSLAYSWGETVQERWARQE